MSSGNSRLTASSISHGLLEEEQLRALIRVTEAVNSYLELDDVLHAIIVTTTEAMEAEAASLILLDENTDELIFHVATGEMADSLSAFRLKRGEGIVGHVIESRQALIVNDAQSDPRFYSKVDDDTGFITRSILCVPMLRGGLVWGAIEVLNRPDDRCFTATDQVLCEAIAGQAAIALENAMLHRKLLSSERLAAVGETVAGLAHCVRNALSGIEGGSYMVDVGLNDGDELTIARGWEIVRRKNAIIQDLVLNMLTYSRERTPDFEPTDLNELVAGVVDLMSVKAGERGVAMNWIAARDMPMAGVDPKAIRRCLFNLAGNAIDASEGDEGAVVTIRLKRAQNGDFLLLVEDQGCGIPRQDIGRLFQPFFSTKGSAGTGLGLAVTQKIIAEHGGRILVESHPGAGSIFSIVLPAERVVDRTAPSAPTRHVRRPVPPAAVADRFACPAVVRSRGIPYKKGTFRVLLIDDDPDILMFLEAALWVFSGVEVHKASDGEEGLDLALALRPDLIVLDLQMPRKDGFSTLKDLAANDSTADIPVIILTGSRDATGIGLSASDMDGYLGHRPAAFLEKPIPSSVLQREVGAILGLDIGEPVSPGAMDRPLPGKRQA